ncbi:hypothetical protein BM221_006340 [Beauveria bassiana]|uniref:Uncharacterized protein n=1 Tax=Beauveria bassiana TaxID=176275 RepID=A0A2N6NLL5_BEABA|nr:hypothetical protein BM221_006340 [Beauveria bassiana]
MLGTGRGVLGEGVSTTAGSGRGHGSGGASAGAVAGAIVGFGISSSAVAHGSSTVALGGGFKSGANRRLAKCGAGVVRHGACAADRHLRGTGYHVGVGLGRTIAAFPYGPCGDVVVAASDGDGDEGGARVGQGTDSGRAGDGGSRGGFGTSGDRRCCVDGGVAAAATVGSGSGGGGGSRDRGRGGCRGGGSRTGCRLGSRISAGCLTSSDAGVGGSCKGSEAEGNVEAHLDKGERMDGSGVGTNGLGGGW